MKQKNNISNFKVPEDYFETFEARLFGKIAEEKFPKAQGFTIPPSYFENIENRILNSLESAAPSKKEIPLFPKKYFGYAAAVAACLLLGFFLFNTANQEPNLDTLQWSSIDSYIEEGNLNLDFYDLTSIIDDSDISGVEIRKWEVSEALLEDYLFDKMETEILKK